MMKKLLLVFLMMSSQICFGQITFQKTYGGTDSEHAISVKQTADDGYIIVGYTYSFGAGNEDVYLIKTNEYGDTLWTKTYGGFGNDAGFYIQETFDGGYILLAKTWAFGAGNADIFLIKINSVGDTSWTKTYGGAADENGFSVEQVSDSGYIVIGYTYSFGAGNEDVYLIRTNSIGDTLWTKTYGGAGYEYGQSILATQDSGFIIVGFTNSFGTGDSDVYIIKTDLTGNLLWSKTFGGTGNDLGINIKQLNIGGYIIQGTTYSFGSGDNDIYLIRINSNGDTLWTKTYGGVAADWGIDLQKTSDNENVIVGFTQSFGTGDWNVYLIKTNSDGDTLWTKMYGGTGTDWGNSIQITSDKGIVIAGETSSFGNGQEFYLIKADENGNSGCNESNTQTIVTRPATQFASPTTITSATNTIITSPATIVGNGGMQTVLCLAVGIQSPIESIEYEIFPNPTHSNFSLNNLSPNERISVEIINVFGEIVYSEKLFGKNEYKIDADFAKGIYFVKVKDVVRKIIVE